MPLRVNADGTLPMWRGPDERTQLAADVATALSAGGPHEHAGYADAATLTAHIEAADPHVAYALDADLVNHTHDGLAPAVHSHPLADHPDAATHLGLGLAAEHAHPYATSAHDHDAAYSGTLHNHDAAYSATGHAHSHNHDGTYAAAVHSHASPFPAGMIVMWAGTLASIPSGWALCDGQNGTPDLRDRFVRGAAAGANPGTAAGSATHSHSFTQPTAATEAAHTHTYTQVVNHTHVITASNTAATSGANATRGTGAQASLTMPNPSGGVATGTTAAGTAHTHTLSGGAVVDGGALPPYYALAFIQKL